MSAEVKSVSLEKAEVIRAEFKDLLARTNKDHPRAEDVKALSDLLNGNKSLELWREVMSAAQYAERAVIENSPAVHGVKECWRLRLASLRIGHTTVFEPEKAIRRAIRKQLVTFPLILAPSPLKKRFAG